VRAGRPSLTARWVAADRDRLADSRPSTPSGDGRGERVLYRDVRGLFAVPWGRPTGLAQRTAFVDNEVAGAIGRGTDQIVLVGAGYDGRALRFAGATRWFEVDRPPTLADKQRRLHVLGLRPPRVTYIGVDLMTGDLDGALDDAGHRAERPSLFVCEGLFAYLTLETIASLCTALRARAAAGSVLVSTILVVPQTGRWATLRALLDPLFGVIGEPRRSEFFAGDAEKLMVVTGWRVSRSQRAPASRLAQGAYSMALAAEPSSGPAQARDGAIRARP
jgi:methyltransferase (TIGR00027 family)